MLFTRSEIAPPEEEETVSWMLLTTERVTNPVVAATILRWYTGSWHIKEYHKILKSGRHAESYRLAATSMEAMLGFLTVIAALTVAGHLSLSHSTTSRCRNSLVSCTTRCSQGQVNQITKTADSGLGS